MPPPSAWQIDSKGPEAYLRLSGDWLVHDRGLQAINEIPDIVPLIGRCTKLRFDTTSVGRWDSSLLAFVLRFLASIDSAESRIDMDLSGLPEPLRRMLNLAPSDRQEIEAADSNPATTRRRVWLSGWWPRRGRGLGPDRLPEGNV